MFIAKRRLISLFGILALFGIFFILPSYVYLASGNSTEVAPKYEYAFNEVTAEGYPSIIDLIKKEAGYEDSETNPVSEERNFISNSRAWSFKLDEQYIMVFLLEEDQKATDLTKNFTLKGYRYNDAEIDTSARLLWETRPEFFAKENVLVIYAGKSKDIGRIIRKNMGDPIVVSET